MKRIIFCTMFLMISTISFSQDQNPTTTFTQQDYLQKSKQQKKTALILAGGGLILELAGVLTYHQGPASLGLFGAGLLSQVVSIPFFISAGVNKHKSKKASVSFMLETTPHYFPTVKSTSSNPAIAVKLFF